MAGRKLTPRQQAFADEYIITGNAEESARVAGYSARGNTSKLLQNTTIKKYIEERWAQLESEKIAGQQEVLEYYTKVMRGEELEEHAFTIAEKVFDEEGGMSINERIETIKLEPKTRDRNKAAEMLGKRYVMWTDKQQTEDITPRFLEDVPDDDD